MAKCTAITRGGTRCKGTASDGSDYCYAHHPDRAEERKRYATKGGKTGGRGRPQLEAADIKGRLSKLADDVLAGNVDKGTAAVVSQIWAVYLRAVAVDMKVKEQSELLEKIEILEEARRRREEESRYGH